MRDFLIIKPSSLGDIIHALPVAAAIRKAVPDAAIDWVAGKGFAGLLEGNQAIRRIVTFDRKMLSGAGGAGRLAGFVSEIRRARYDAVIDLQGLLRSGLMSAACRAGMKIGFANAREGAPLFYNRVVDVPDPNVHAVERYLLALEHVGVGRPERPEFVINITEADRAEALGILQKAGIGEGEAFVAAAPGARWATKRWPAERFREVAGMLYRSRGVKTVFVGAAGDAGLYPDGLAGEGMHPAFGATTLRGLAALLGMARTLLTNDSGPMHVAAAVGTKVVSLFGPTDFVRTGPYGPGHRVITAGLACAPCFHKECGDLMCMDGIPASQVAGEIEKLL